MEFKLVRGLFCQVLHTDPISMLVYPLNALNIRVSIVLASSRRLSAYPLIRHGKMAKVGKTGPVKAQGYTGEATGRRPRVEAGCPSPTGESVR